MKRKKEEKRNKTASPINVTRLLQTPFFGVPTESADLQIRQPPDGPAKDRLPQAHCEVRVEEKSLRERRCAKANEKENERERLSVCVCVCVYVRERERGRRECET